MKKAIVIGAGVVGLAVARALKNTGVQVSVFDRHPKAQGASVRNFGMIWPVGQAQGPRFDRAMRSREIWLDLCRKADFFAEQTGALHLAYTDLEMQVVQEYTQALSGVKSAQVLSPQEVSQKSPAAKLEGLKGALWTQEELIVDPREAILKTAQYLAEAGVAFHWGCAISRIEGGRVYSGREFWDADQVYVCTGADFEILYPELYREIPITKCKLQMARLVKQPDHWRIGPPLCSGLSFIHYKGFEVAPSLVTLKEVYEKEFPELLEWGIHVMVSQNGLGELTIGDSHEYGLDLSPFDQEKVNQLILDFLRRFADFKDWRIASTWHGIYSKMTNGATELIHPVSDQEIIVNGLGGAGMTLSFGLGEEVVKKYGI